MFKVNNAPKNAPQREAFKLMCYFKLTKLKEVKKVVSDSMATNDLP